MLSYEERQQLKLLVSNARKKGLNNNTPVINIASDTSNDNASRNRHMERYNNGLEVEGEGFRCRECDKWTHLNGYKRH